LAPIREAGCVIEDVARGNEFHAGIGRHAPGGVLRQRRVEIENPLART